jgi:hypothetical protein
MLANELAVATTIFDDQEKNCEAATKLLSEPDKKPGGITHEPFKTTQTDA